MASGQYSREQVLEMIESASRSLSSPLREQLSSLCGDVIDRTAAYRTSTSDEAAREAELGDLNRRIVEMDRLGGAGALPLFAVVRSVVGFLPASPVPPGARAAPAPAAAAAAAAAPAAPGVVDAILAAGARGGGGAGGGAAGSAAGGGWAAVSAEESDDDDGGQSVATRVSAVAAARKHVGGVSPGGMNRRRGTAMVPRAAYTVGFDDDGRSEAGGGGGGPPEAIDALNAAVADFPLARRIATRELVREGASVSAKLAAYEARLRAKGVPTVGADAPEALTVRAYPPPPPAPAGVIVTVV